MIRDLKIKSLFKDTAIYGFGSVLRQFIGLLLVPFYTRALSPGDYGILNSLTVLVSILTLLGNAGMLGGINRYFFKGANELEKKEIISTGIIYSVLVMTVLVVLLIPFTAQLSLVFLDSENYSKLVFLTLIIAFFTLISSFFDQVFMLYRDAKKYLIVMIGRAVLNPLLGITLVVVLGMGVLGAQLTSLITLFTGIILSYFLYVRNRINLKVNKEWSKKMFAYGLPFIGAGISQWIYSSCDRIFLAHYSSMEEIGYFSISSTFAQPIQLLNMALSMSLGVITISNFEKEADPDKPETKAFLIRTWTLYLSLTGIATLFLSIFSANILGFVTTKSYLPGAAGILFQCFIMIVFQSGQTTGGGMSMVEKTRLYFWATLISATSNILFNFILVPRLGYKGALISTLASNLIYFLLVYTWSQKYFKVNYPITRITLFMSVIFAIGLFFSYPIKHLPMNLTFILKTIVFAFGCTLPFVFGLLHISSVTRFLKPILAAEKEK